MVIHILGEAVPVVVTALMAEKAPEKWRRPLWIVFVVLVFSLAGLQIHSWRVDTAEAEQREKNLNQKFDSVNEQLRESLLAQVI